MSTVLDRSREYSQRALQLLQEVRKKYPLCPAPEKLPEQEHSWLREHIRCFGEAIKNIGYKGFSFYEDARRLRNTLAHMTETASNSDAVRKIYTAFFDFAPQAEAELVSNIQKAYAKNKDIRRFEKFDAGFGTEAERKLFVDAVQSSYYDGSDAFEPQGLTGTQKRIYDAAVSAWQPQEAEQQELLSYARELADMADPMQADIVKWAAAVNQTLAKTNPFAQEEAFIAHCAQKDAAHISDAAEALHSQYTELPSVQQFPPDVNWNFYTAEFSRLKAEQEVKQKEATAQLKVKQKAKRKKVVVGERSKSAPPGQTLLRLTGAVSEQPDNVHEENTREERKAALVRSLIADMQKELERRKTAWELELIQQEREKLLKDLYDKLARLKKLRETLRSITGHFGRLWDLCEQQFNDAGFEILEQYADLLSQDEGLQELAKLLGRHCDEEQKFRRELRAKIVVETVHNPEPAYKGEICGLRLSNHIADVIPSELALYSNEKTRQIFKMKFAQQQLLSYAYTHNIEYVKTHEEQEEVLVGETIEHKGPMIICVDTSGSMTGTPERVAKTIAFALAQKSFEEERSCYLISFSTGIETLDLSSFASAQGFERLVQFLRMSFHGGTDAAPALTHAVKLLQEQDWKNADVLMISDFQMGSLPQELEAQIEKQKEGKTRFFSLAIAAANSGNNGLAVFNNNWIYDANARDAGAKLVRQLAEISET